MNGPGIVTTTDTQTAVAAAAAVAIVVVVVVVVVVAVAVAAAAAAAVVVVVVVAVVVIPDCHMTNKCAAKLMFQSASDTKNVSLLTTDDNTAIQVRQYRYVDT